MTTPSQELITVAQLKAIAGPATKSKQAGQTRIIEQTVDALNLFASAYGLDEYFVLAKFLGQLCVESDSFCTTTEYASGKAYEGRKDLGNTVPGDGTKFRGRGLIQTTGRANVTKFWKWALKSMTALVKDPIPNLVEQPGEIAKFPYAFFSAVYYWNQGNPTGKSLSTYAADDNQETITVRINGGMTHFDRRLAATTRASLVFLGYKANAIKDFQRKSGLVADGIVGKQTRLALHNALFKLSLDGHADEIADKVELDIHTEIALEEKPDGSTQATVIPPLVVAGAQQAVTVEPKSEVRKGFNFFGWGGRG